MGWQKDNWTQMKDLDNQIHQQVTSDKMDQAAVDALVDKKTNLIGNMMKAKISATNQIFVILTPKQRMDFQNKMNKRDEKIAAKFKACHESD